MGNWTIGKPRQGSQWRAADHLGELVLFINPVLEDVETRFGSSEAAKCSYVVSLDTGEVETEVIVFGSALAPQIVGDGIQNITLGRISQGAAKPGQSPAWILEPAEEKDEEVAGKWLDDHASQDKLGNIKVSL